MKLIPEIIECRLCGLVHAAKNCQINSEEISPVQQVQMELEKLQSFLDRCSMTVSTRRNMGYYIINVKQVLPILNQKIYFKERTLGHDILNDNHKQMGTEQVRTLVEFFSEEVPVSLSEVKEFIEIIERLKKLLFTKTTLNPIEIE